ncbi:uncharacterized protein LOC610321 isoform X6 [Canis lupus familiaris]|uniref:uncharacterized protein LOC610321 isoform X6 n=1 Tax=Canis lupus familiaris TaxID=9615 RepID=UPI000BAA12F7|nr:uncharacterized protein LOC610321 isoform X6 [Canis lupus familiaris]XP_038412848.1 uncharacterized protein LOC610321 isoform X6 [Canis lupus familiaris]XP_038542476.1 uncharacterized protein LOC610321 isoform X6 [Canis lupus familiaris]|eukprot:XP_022283102.1 uncharacterized protein LOC610321 isoform X5 [Canis lupus familiaris]
MGGNQQLFIWKMSVDFPKSSRLSLFKFRFPCAVESCKETAAMFHFFRKSPESKKPSVPDTEADGFVLLETIQVVTEKAGSKYEEEEEIRAIHCQKLLCRIYQCSRNSFLLY